MTDEQITNQINALENKKRGIEFSDYPSREETFTAIDTIDREITALRAQYSIESHWDKVAQELKKRGYLPRGETFN